MSLSWLKELLSHVKVYETGYAFVLSRNGVFVSHPDSGVIMRRTIFSLAEEIGDAHLRRLGKDMTHGGTDFVRLNHPVSGKDSWLYYTPVPTSGWSVGIIFPDEELYAGVRRLSEEVLFIFVAGIVFLFAAVAFVSRSITKPIERLAASADEIARGNLDADLPAIKTRDEIGRLAESFGNMKTSLKEYIANLAQTTAAKERIESELKIARTIQMSFLPRNPLYFPGRPLSKSTRNSSPPRKSAGTSTISSTGRRPAVLLHRGCVGKGDSRSPFHGRRQDADEGQGGTRHRPLGPAQQREPRTLFREPIHDVCNGPLRDYGCQNG